METVKTVSSSLTLEQLEELVQKKQQEMNEIIKSGLEIVEENKQLKGSLEQSKNQINELQMDLESYRIKQQELTHENQCLQNNNLQLLQDLNSLEDKSNLLQEKIQHYETLIQSIEKERDPSSIIPSSIVDDSNISIMDRDISSTLQNNNNNNNNNNNINNNINTMVETTKQQQQWLEEYDDIISKMQNAMKKYEEENQGLKEKEKLLSDYVQRLVIEKVGLEKQIVILSSSASTGNSHRASLSSVGSTDNHRNNNNTRKKRTSVFLASNNDLLLEINELDQNMDNDNMYKLEETEEEYNQDINNNNNNNNHMEEKKKEGINGGGGDDDDDEYSRSVITMSDPKHEPQSELGDLPNDNDNDNNNNISNREDQNNSTITTDLNGGGGGSGSNGNNNKEDEEKTTKIIENSIKSKNKRAKYNDAYQEYLHLTCAAVKIQYPNVDISLERLIAIVREKDLPFYRVYEFLSRHMLDTIQWQEKEQAKLNQLKESVIAAQQEHNTQLKTNRVSRIWKSLWSSTNNNNTNQPSLSATNPNGNNNTSNIQAIYTKTGGMSLQLNGTINTKIKTQIKRK